jgi:hypothetical protein
MRKNFYNYTRAAEEMDKLQKTPNRLYGNQEEMETTTTYEHSAAKATGEDIRTSHDEDEAYETTGPTNRESVRPW